jgi:MFS family permease
LAKFDYAGAALSVMTVLLLVGSLFALRSHLWLVFVLLVVGSGLLGLVFIKEQLHSASPILHADVLTNPTFLNGNIMALIIFAIMMGISTTLPLYLASRSISSDTAGFLLSFQAIPIFAISFWAGLLADRYSAKVVALTGAVIVLAGVAVMAFAFHLNVIYVAAVGNAVLGIGIGFFNPSNQKIVMSSVDNKHASVAASTNVLFRNLGVATGTALAGIIFGVFESLGDRSPFTPGVGTLLFFLLLASTLVLIGGYRGIKSSKGAGSTTH